MHLIVSKKQILRKQSILVFLDSFDWKFEYSHDHIAKNNAPAIIDLMLNEDQMNDHCRYQ